MATTTLYSVKGGSGTSVTAAALAATIGRNLDTGARLLDLDGDARPILGLPAALGDDRRAFDYLDTGDLRDIDSATILAGYGLGLLDGSGPIECDKRPLDVLLAHFDHTLLDAGPVVIDAGTIDPHRLDRDARARRHLLDSTISVLVLRPCYLALRRALDFGHRPDLVVLIEEPGRALGVSDVRDVLGVEVFPLPFDPAVARCVDAGLLGSRVPADHARRLDALTGRLAEAVRRERERRAEAVETVEAPVLMCADCLGTWEGRLEAIPGGDALLIEVCDGCQHPTTVIACREVEADPLCVETCAPLDHGTGRSIVTRCACCGASGLCAV